MLKDKSKHIKSGEFEQKFILFGQHQTRRGQEHSTNREGLLQRRRGSKVRNYLIGWSGCLIWKSLICCDWLSLGFNFLNLEALIGLILVCCVGVNALESTSVLTVSLFNQQVYLFPLPLKDVFFLLWHQFYSHYFPIEFSYFFFP